MAENYKILYEQMKKMVEKYQDDIVPGLRMVIDRLEAERKWISVEDRLPEPEQEVLLCVRSKISNYSYVCCARYVPENWYRESSDFCWDLECCDEYDEEQDDFIVKPGWYESIHNSDDDSVVGIEDIVTHWMQLPEPQTKAYVMTADRCPEYERLLKILKETKWIGGASGG